MQRMEPTAHVRTALTWTPEGRKKGGLPRTTRGRTVMEETRSTVLSDIGWKRATKLTQDRTICRDLVDALSATRLTGLSD